MRTTLDIPDEVMTKVLQISGRKKRGEAVRTALEDYVRRNALELLLSLPGTIEIEDVSEELERIELAEA